MTTITIVALMTDRIAQSEDVVSDASTGLTDYANIKLRTIALAKWWVYGSEKDDSLITDAREKEYIAFVALLRLIPTLMDWFRDKRRLSDSKEGTTHTWYDHVTELHKVLAQVRADVARMRGDVERLIWDTKATGKETAIQVSTIETHAGVEIAGTDFEDYMATEDPFRQRFRERVNKPID